MAELARAEIDRTPQEDPEPEPDPEPTPEPAPEPEPEPAPPALGIAPEKVAAAIEKEHARHLKELTRIMGAAPLFECEVCNTLGYTLEPSMTQAGLLDAPDMTKCPECDGWGQVITGARQEAAPVWQCSKCGGNGWVTKPRELAPPATWPAPAAANGPVFNQPYIDIYGQPSAVPPDAYGQLDKDPNYGRPRPATAPAA